MKVVSAFVHRRSTCHEDICFSLLARIMSSEAPRPSPWQICVVPASPWRTDTNTGLPQHVSAHMEGSLFIVLRCEETVKPALCVKYRRLAACAFVLVSITKPVSSPGSTPASLRWLQPLLITYLSDGVILLGTDGWYAQIWSWLFVMRRQRSIMAEWMFLCGGISHQLYFLQLFTHLNVEQPPSKYIWSPSSYCCFPMVWMYRQWGRGATVYCGRCACVLVVVPLPHSHLSLSFAFPHLLHPSVSFLLCSSLLAGKSRSSSIT